MQAVAADMLADNYDASATAWQQMKTEFPNIKVMIFPEDVLKAMKKANDEVMLAYAAQNAEFKEVYDSQQAYMKKAREWSRISTQYYLETTQMVEK
jgi:TRAP-type mannitol/chloroaromatic compound transport system substrate-binding protein